MYAKTKVFFIRTNRLTNVRYLVVYLWERINLSGWINAMSCLLTRYRDWLTCLSTLSSNINTQRMDTRPFTGLHVGFLFNGHSQPGQRVQQILLSAGDVTDHVTFRRFIMTTNIGQSARGKQTERDSNATQ